MADSFWGSSYDRVKASEQPQLKPLRSTWLNDDEVATRLQYTEYCSARSQQMSNSFTSSITTQSSIVRRGVGQLDKQQTKRVVSQKYSARGRTAVRPLGQHNLWWKASDLRAIKTNRSGLDRGQSTLQPGRIGLERERDERATSG